MSAQGDYNRSQSQAARSEQRAVTRAKGGKPKAHRPKSHKPKAHRPKPLNPLDDPGQVTRPQTMRDIYGGADASANLRYGGQERQLGLQTQQVPAWFAAYRAQVAGINQGIQTGYQNAITDVNTRAQQAQTTENTGRSQLQQAAQKDAASRGASIDPSLYQNDASAGGVRRENQNAFANLLSSQGQAQNTYFGGLQAAGSAAELGQQQRIAQDKTNVAADKGQYKSQYVTDARQTEHKNRLEDKAFNLDVYQAQTGAADTAAGIKAGVKKARAQRKAAAKGEANSVITSGAFAGKTHGWVRNHPKEADALTNSYNKITHPAKAKTGPAAETPAAKAKRIAASNKQTTRITDAESRWNIYKDTTGTQKQGDKKIKRKPTPTEIKQRLIKEGFSTPEIHLALMWSSSKPWTPKDKRIAKRLGIRLPKKKPRASAPGGPNGTGLL